jgi:signal transduction histidine kinase
MIQTLFEMLTALLHLTVILFLSRIKPSWKDCLLYAAGFIPFLFISVFLFVPMDFYVRSALATPILIVTLTFLTYISEKNLSLCLVYAALSLSIVFMTASFTTSIFSLIFYLLPETPQLSNVTILRTWYWPALYLVVVSIFGGAVARVVGKFIKAKISPFDENMKKKAIRLLLPGVLATFTMFFADTFVIPIFYGSEWHPLITSFMYAGIFIALIYSIFAATDSIQKQADIQLYRVQCQIMQESVENIRSIRHDMKLHLTAVRDFTANNNSPEATDYLNSLLGDLEKNEIYSSTKNTAFDSIINFKLNSVKQENIKLDIRLSVPPALNIEPADIVTILGNLLDNALDAVSKVEEKIIKLDIEYSRESLFIQVENTFDGVVKKDNAQIITRKENGGGHGLKNIRKSVEKYNGHIDISHEGNIFSVGILLYNFTF